MPSTEAQRNEARAAEIVELAIAGLVVNLGLSQADAAKTLLQGIAKRTKPAAVRETLKAVK